MEDLKYDYTKGGMVPDVGYVTHIEMMCTPDYWPNEKYVHIKKGGLGDPDFKTAVIFSSNKEKILPGDPVKIHILGFTEITNTVDYISMYAVIEDGWIID